MDSYENQFRDERPPRPVARQICDVCQHERSIPSHWQRKICASCRDGDPVLKRCSRCKLHKRHPAKGWTAYYCPDCSRESSRLYRERLKAEGKTTLKIAVCIKCGTKSELPEGHTCRPCRNAYQRQWRKAHPPKKPEYKRAGHEDSRKCSKCKQWEIFSESAGWRGGVCGRWAQRYRVKAHANRKAQIEGWRATGAMIECSTCHGVQSYGVGWSLKVCPACVSIHSKAQQEAVKADPKRAANRRAKRNAARKRRESAQGGVSAPPSPAGGGHQGG